MNPTDQPGQAPTNDTPPMTPTIHKIADTKPVFPCWLYTSNAYQHENEWVHHSFCPWHFPGVWKSDYTHWCHSDTRPTVTPEAEPTVTVGIGLDGRPLAGAHMPQAMFGELIDHRPIAHTVATDSANPSPRPACDCVEKVAEEIWDCAFDAYCTHNGGTTAHESAHNAVAAILRKHFGSEADELRRRDEEKDAAITAMQKDKAMLFERVQAGLERNAENFQRALRAEERAEKAEAERAALKAEVERLTKDAERLTKLDRLISEDGRLELILRWDSQNDWITILDGAGFVWGEAPTPDDIEDSEGNGATLRAAIDSIEGRCAKRRVKTEDEILGSVVDEWATKCDQLRAQLAASEQRLKEAEAMADLIRFRVLDWKKNGRGVAAFRRDRMEALSDALAKFDAARSTSSTGWVKP